MKIGVTIAAYSVDLSLYLDRCCSFRSGVVRMLLLRFAPPFKCTVDNKLQMLITPYSDVLCN